MCQKCGTNSCNCACKGEAGARGPQGVAGPMGPQGIPGAPGFNGWSLLGNTVTNSTSVLGSLDNFPFSFITDGTERARFLSTGELGIGTATPTETLHVVGNIRQDVTYTNIVADVKSFNQNITIDSPVNTAFNLFGTNTSMIIPIGNTSNYTGTSIGHLIEFNHNGSGTVGSAGNIIFALNGSLNNNNGSFDVAAGLLGSVINNSALASNLFVGVAAQVSNFSTAPIATTTGILIVTTDNSGGGTIGQVYGIDIKDQSGIGVTDSWNILSEGVNSLNIFEGSIGIGQGGPTAMLHIGATNTGTFRFEDGNQALGFVLTSDVSGNATWQSNGSGTVTSVTGSGNIASSGGVTPNITFTGILPIANGGTNIATIGVAGSSAYSNGTQYVFTAAGVAGQTLTSNGVGAPTWVSPGSVNWSLLGNSGTVSGTNFVGTTDNVNLMFKVFNIQAGLLDVVLANTFYGISSGLSNAGANNTGIGTGALNGNTTGGQNTAVGDAAMLANTAGVRNTAVGYNSLFSNQTLSDNTAIGYRALYFNRSLQNTALGANSLYSNVTGNSGVAIGFSAMLYANSSAISFTNYNTAVGFQAYRGSTTAANNTGNYNTVIGYDSLRETTSGSNNVTLGYQTLYSNTTGSSNVAIATNALFVNTVGNNNIAVGESAAFSNTSGSNIVAIGFQAMEFCNDTVTPFSNTNMGVGYQALRGSVTASSNTGIGNTAIGYQSISNYTLGADNTGLGYQTLLDLTTGDSNTAIGYQAGLGIITGSENTIIGANITVADISNNVILGDGAGTIRLQFSNTGAISLNTVAVTVESVTSDETLTVTINGVTKKILLKA